MLILNWGAGRLKIRNESDLSQEIAAEISSEDLDTIIQEIEGEDKGEDKDKGENKSRRRGGVREREIFLKEEALDKLLSALRGNNLERGNMVISKGLRDEINNRACNVLIQMGFTREELEEWCRCRKDDPKSVEHDERQLDILKVNMLTGIMDNPWLSRQGEGQDVCMRAVVLLQQMKSREKVDFIEIQELEKGKDKFGQKIKATEASATAFPMEDGAQGEKSRREVVGAKEAEVSLQSQIKGDWREIVDSHDILSQECFGLIKRLHDAIDVREGEGTVSVFVACWLFPGKTLGNTIAQHYPGYCEEEDEKPVKELMNLLEKIPVDTLKKLPMTEFHEAIKRHFPPKSPRKD